MKFFCSILLFLFLPIGAFAQYSFKGEVAPEFAQKKIYLFLVDDYRTFQLNIPEQIIKTSEIRADGSFEFIGNDISEQKNIYKIVFNNCGTDESSQSFLTSCDESNSIIFIANNTSSISFPINALNQSFCEVDNNHTFSKYLFKIDSLHHDLQYGIFDTKSNSERNLIYKNWFLQLKEFAQQTKEPLAELYAFQLYTDSKFMGRKYYEQDFKKNTSYYDGLLDRLEPESNYYNQLKTELAADKFTLLSKNTHNNGWILATIILAIGLLLALFWVYKLQSKVKNSIPEKINYREILTPQEITIIELIQLKKSNKSIADQLCISLSTVKTHINNIYTKLNISSRKEVGKFFE